MLKCRIGLICLLINSSICLWAQNSNYLHTRNIIDRLSTRSYGVTSAGVVGIPMPAAEVKGDVYLSNTYNICIFELYDNEILSDGYYAKLDLQKNEFDLLTKQGVRVLFGKKVRAFANLDSVNQNKSYFVNGKEWTTEDNTHLDCFFQILSNGDLMLVKRTELIFKKADYNPALNVGNRDHRYIKKNHYYYVKADKVMKLPGKKQFNQIFGDKADAISSYIKTNQLSTQDEQNLITIFNHYNGKE